MDALNTKNLFSIKDSINYLVYLNNPYFSYKHLNEELHKKYVFSRIFDDFKKANEAIKVNTYDIDWNNLIKKIDSLSLEDMTKAISEGYTNKQSPVIKIKKNPWPLFDLTLAHEVGHLLYLEGYNRKIADLKEPLEQYFAKNNEKDTLTLHEELAAFIMEVLFAFEASKNTQDYIKAFNLINNYVAYCEHNCHHLSAAYALVEYLENNTPLNLTQLYLNYSKGGAKELQENAEEMYQQCIKTAEKMVEENTYKKVEEYLKKAYKVISFAKYFTLKNADPEADKKYWEITENSFIKWVKNFEKETGVEFKEIYEGFKKYKELTL